MDIIWGAKESARTHESLRPDSLPEIGEILRADIFSAQNQQLITDGSKQYSQKLWLNKDARLICQTPMESTIKETMASEDFREKFSGSLFLIGGNKTDDAFDAIVPLFRAHNSSQSQSPKVTVIGTAEKDGPLAAAEKIARGFEANGVKKKDITILIPRSETLDQSREFRQSHDVPCNTDIAYFGGGYQDVLVTKVDAVQLRQIKGLLTTGKMVVGSSAGAAVMSSEMISDGDEKNLVHMPGFRIMPWAVMETHVGDRNREPRALTALYEIAQEKLPVIGMDRDTGVRLFWKDQNLYGTVYGKGFVHIIQPLGFPPLQVTRVTKGAAEQTSTNRVDNAGSPTILIDSSQPERKGNVWRLDRDCTFKVHITSGT